MRWVCYILSVCLAAAIAGCQSDAGTLGLVYNTSDRSYSLVITDTTAVRMSTVLLDSIPTSAGGSTLIGKYEDPKLGTIESKGYVQVDLGSSWNPTSDLTYDSMVLVMRYSGYYYGDTTQTQTYEVRQVAEDFITYNLSAFWIDQMRFSTLTSTFFPPNSLYNRRALKVDEVSPPLATFKLKPRPSSSDSIVVRLSDAVGQAWMDEAKKVETGAFDFQSNFLKYFKGLCIRSTSANGAAIIGLATTRFTIRLYFKGMVNEIITGMHRNFSFNASTSINYNYNNITSDRSGTLLASLSPSKKELSSKLTDNESYIESGVGLLTKISFPNIMNVPATEGFRQINSARLIVEPVNQSYNNKFLLPTTLTLFATDNSNLPIQPLFADYSSAVQSATIGIDSEHSTNSAYIFSVTQYVQSLINAGGPGRTGSALFLSLPPSSSQKNVQNLFNSIHRLRISNDPGAQYHTRLEIYYLRQN